MTDQEKALAAFRAALGGNAEALAHFDRVAPELVRRIGDRPKLPALDKRDPTAALVWDWFNAHYPGSPASRDPALWAALHETAVPALIAALAPNQEH